MYKYILKCVCIYYAHMSLEFVLKSNAQIHKGFQKEILKFEHNHVLDI